MQLRTAGQGDTEQPAGESGVKAIDTELADFWRDRAGRMGAVIRRRPPRAV